MTLQYFSTFYLIQFICSILIDNIILYSLSVPYGYDRV